MTEREARNNRIVEKVMAVWKLDSDYQFSGELTEHLIGKAFLQALYEELGPWAGDKD
jgi:hypothetical protein